MSKYVNCNICAEKNICIRYCGKTAHGLLYSLRAYIFYSVLGYNQEEKLNDRIAFKIPLMIFQW